MRRRDSGGPLEQDRTPEPNAERKDKMMDQAALETVDEELRDFLAADLLDVPADPSFKERLRRELWEIVERNAIKWRESLRSAPADDPDDYER